MSSCFIVLEGPEGGGKTFQTAQLAAALRAEGREVLEVREPGGTPLGDEVRSILLDTQAYAILPEAETLLLAASRAQLVREVINPALDRGAVVLCDRFVDSTYAYQGGGRQLPLEEIARIQAFATAGLQPDLRVLLDLPASVGLARRYANHGSVNRIDRADLDFHERVRDTYLALVKEHPDDWVVIDATKPAGEVSRAINAAVRAKLGVASGSMLSSEDVMIDTKSTQGDDV